jgi:chromosome segregation ATPase
MADEEQVARLTDQIANSLAKAQSTMKAVADATHDFDRVMGRRLEDVRTLPQVATNVRKAEAEGRVARNGTERDNADDLVRGGFRSAQVTAGHLVEQLGGAQRELEQLRREIEQSSKMLEGGAKALDELERLPDRKTPETENLRSRLDNFRRGVDAAGTGLGQAMGRLETARRTAAEFEVRPMAIDDSGRVSGAIETTASGLNTEVKAARAGLEGLTQQVDRDQPDARQAAAKSIELANAARAGLNPTQPSAQRATAGNAEQDLRHREGIQSALRGLDR